MGSSLLSEIREFLAGLRRELPDVFKPLPAAGTPPLPAVPRAFRSLDSEVRNGPLGTRDHAGSARAVLFESRAAHWSRAMGVSHGRIRVKDHKSLWGSCTATNELNFNWRLLLAPPEVLDYVVVHELSHIVVKDHSRRFWDEVSRWCPDHRQHRRWLRLNGPALMRRRKRPELGDHEGVVDQAASR